MFLTFKAAKIISEEMTQALIAEGAGCISRCSGSTQIRMNIFAVQADLTSNHCMRQDPLHAETWRRATRGRTVRRLTKKRCSLYAVLLHLTDNRSGAVILRTHTSRARSRHGRCCIVSLREGFQTTTFRSPTSCCRSYRYKELLETSTLCHVRLWSQGESNLQGFLFIRA